MSPSDPGDVILLVEDSRDDALLVERAFTHATVQNPIRHLPSAEQAMAYLSGIGPYADRSKHPFPIMILLDISLPGMNGLEFLRWLRTQPGLRRIPAVMLTVSADQTTVNAAYDAGANSYLIKPGEPGEVRRVIDTIRQYWLSYNVKPAIVLRSDARAGDS